MSGEFTGKVYAISGAASGIALATAQHLYSLGASLSITDVRRDALATAANTIQGPEYIVYRAEKSGDGILGVMKEVQNATAADADKRIDTGNPRILAVVTDVRRSEQVDAWIAKTVDVFGRLDGAANLAGVVGRHIGTGTLLDVTDQDWDFMVGINLTGVFYAVRAQVRAMKALIEAGKQESASIVNAASTAGIEGNAKNTDYSAAKHGVVGLTRSAAKEWGGMGIRVNAVAPGVIATPMVQTLPQSTQDGIDALVKNGQALHRKAQPLEIGKLVTFLLSDNSSFTSGAVYVADGGQVC